MNCMREASSYTISDPQFHSEQRVTNGIIQSSEQGFVQQGFLKVLTQQ